MLGTYLESTNFVLAQPKFGQMYELVQILNHLTNHISNTPHTQRRRHRQATLSLSLLRQGHMLVLQE